MKMCELDTQKIKVQPLVEAIISWADLPDRLTRLEEASQRTLQSVGAIETFAEALCRQSEVLVRKSDAGTNSLEHLHAKVGEILDRQESIDLVHSQNALLTEQHYESHILEPLAHRLFPVIDLIDTALKQNGFSANGDQVENVLWAVHAQVFDLLAIYGIEPIEVPVGSPFVSRSMQAGKSIPAPHPQAVGTVASTIRRGFQKGERVLRPPVVSVYSEPKNTITQENCNGTNHRN